MTRRTKTPAERAQEQFDVAARIAERLHEKQQKAAVELDRLTDEHAAAVRRRDYLAQHPDLPKQKTPANQSGATPA